MRIRFRFAKVGKIRFTSQRDVARMWERALRRAALPLAYTEGFSPRPQLSFGLALPTCCESLAEYLDVVLDDHRAQSSGVEVADLPGQLSDLLPAGIDVQAAALADRRAGSLQQLVTSCSWAMSFTGVSRAELSAQVAALLAARSVPIVRERKGREEHDDLRPAVLNLAVGEGPEGIDLVGRGSIGVVAELATHPRGVRPVELVRGLAAVAGQPESFGTREGMTGIRTEGIPVLDRACRTQQWIERDGIREEPLGVHEDAGSTGRATHALERAS
jgi:radical SAM-linked protein